MFKSRARAAPVVWPLRRYFVPAAVAGGSGRNGAPLRSCIKNMDTGERWLELPREVRRHLFLDLDKGPESWPSTFWMYDAGCIRGACTDDWMHTTWNGVRLAMTHCKLSILNQEITLCLNMFTAPFGGDTFWGQICEAMHEYQIDALGAWWFGERRQRSAPGFLQLLGLELHVALLDFDKMSHDSAPT